MASTLSSATLADLVAKAKLVLGIEDDDATYHADAIALYNTDGTATAATVQVTDTILDLVQTGGIDAVGNTTSITLADEATLTELVAAVDALSAWNATLVGDGGADSTKLVRTQATSALGQANEQTLAIENLALLELLITNAFASIETYLCRDLITADRDEVYQFPQSSRILVLDQPDVLTIDRLMTDTLDAMRVVYAGTGNRATMEVTDDSVILRSIVDGVAATVTVTRSADPTIGDVVDAINGAGEDSYTATVLKDYDTLSLITAGPVNVFGGGSCARIWEDQWYEYTTDRAAGVIDFEAPEWNCARQVRIEYSAGLGTAPPADVEGVLLGLVKSGWDGAKVDGTLTSERLGDYSYQSGGGGQSSGGGGGSGMAFDMGPYAATLSKYRAHAAMSAEAMILRRGRKVTVQRQTSSGDGAAYPVPTYANHLTNEPAFIQMASGITAFKHGRPQSDNFGVVYMMAGVDVEPDDRILYDGRTLHVLSKTKPGEFPDSDHMSHTRLEVEERGGL